MADAVTSQTLSDGDRTAVMKFTNISDGSGEASVAKVDVPALTKHSTTAADVLWLKDCTVTRSPGVSYTN